MSDIVKSLTQSDHCDVSSKVGKNVQAQEQEVKDCTEFLKIVYEKYRHYKIILEAVNECLEGDNLDDKLRKKITGIILGVQLSQIRLTENSSEITSNEAVLGVPLTNCELTFSESNELKNCLKDKLDNKYRKIKYVYSSLLGKNLTNFNNKDIDNPLDIVQQDVELMEFKKKLIMEQECYIKHQLQLFEFLEELKNIRLKMVPKLTERKIDECTLRSKINYLKSLLATQKCRVDIFMETTYSFRAYTELIRDIKDQQEELKTEINRLKDLKKKYAQISCMEYNEILKSYLQYKSALEKKRKIYECIHGKP